MTTLQNLKLRTLSNGSVLATYILDGRRAASFVPREWVELDQLTLEIWAERTFVARITVNSIQHDVENVALETITGALEQGADANHPMFDTLRAVLAAAKANRLDSLTGETAQVADKLIAVARGRRI